MQMQIQSAVTGDISECSSLSVTTSNSTGTAHQPRRRPVEVTVQTYWYFFIKVHDICSWWSKQEDEDDFLLENLEIVRNFYPPPPPPAWLRIRGLEKRESRCRGQWQYNFVPINVVADKSPLFEACRTGNLERVKYLVRKKKASLSNLASLRVASTR